MKKRVFRVLMAIGMCVLMMVSGCSSSAPSISNVSTSAVEPASSMQKNEDISELEKEFSDKEKAAESFKDDDTSVEAVKTIEQAIEAGDKLLDAYNVQSSESKAKEDGASDKANKLQKKLFALKERKKTCDEKKAQVVESSEPTASATPEASHQPTAQGNIKASEESNGNTTAAQSAQQKQANTQKKNVVTNNNSSVQTQKTPTCTPYTINHPAETHQEPTYTTVHHDEQGHNETIIDSPAYDEQVASGDVLICNFCKQQFSTLEDLENHSDLVHDAAASYTIVPQFKTVHHDAVTHLQWVIDQPAYDEKVQSGTTTVVDKEAWTEQGCK